MSEYTQGGWAKLDTQAAFHLAEILATFQGEKFEQYARLLMILYSSISRDGSTSIGYRTLAERAEVTERQARYFLTKLEKSGVLVKMGDIKTPGGRYQKKRFYWLVETKDQVTDGETKNCPTHATKSIEILSEGATKSIGKLSHIRYTDISDMGSVAASNDAPPHQTDDSTTAIDDPFIWMPPPKERGLD